MKALKNLPEKTPRSKVGKWNPSWGFMEAACTHLVQVFTQGYSYSDEDWAERMSTLRKLWGEATPAEKVNANSWLRWIYADRDYRCPLVDLPLNYGWGPPRGHLSSWGDMPFNWEFYLAEDPRLCRSCERGWGLKGGSCRGCGKPLGEEVEPADELLWQAFIGLDFIDGQDGWRLIEINGSNYGLKGYFSLCGDQYNQHSKLDFYMECYETPERQWARFASFLIRGWIPHRASHYSRFVWAERNKKLEKLFDSKTAQRVLHPDPLPSWRAGETPSGHDYYVHKPVKGSCGKGIYTTSEEQPVKKGFIAEPLVRPRTDRVRVLRAGLVFHALSDGTLQIYHVASYWRVNPRPFDPENTKSVVTNLSKDAEAQLITKEELKTLRDWVESWAPLVLQELGFKRYELHLNFDAVRTKESRV